MEEIPGVRSGSCFLKRAKLWDCTLLFPSGGCKTTWQGSRLQTLPFSLFSCFFAGNSCVVRKKKKETMGKKKRIPTWFLSCSNTLLAIITINNYWIQRLYPRISKWGCWCQNDALWQMFLVGEKSPCSAINVFLMRGEKNPCTRVPVRKSHIFPGKMLPSKYSRQLCSCLQGLSGTEECSSEF